MTKQEKIYFEVYYHPNQYTQTFRYALENMRLVEEALKKDYPDFTMVDEEEIKFPFISVSNKKYTQEQIISIFFAKSDN